MGCVDCHRSTNGGCIHGCLSVSSWQVTPALSDWTVTNGMTLSSLHSTVQIEIGSTLLVISNMKEYIYITL